ncbi:hypothetical protein [Caballeronia sp. DA-9]|uniref:hypothetical protein n=1 Tax=Caballeronia sp. DA-9 TaxID=3436237 RepID=UPI003F6735A2
MKSDRICAACGARFTPLVHIVNQRYCPLAACQLARRRAWQRERLQTDPDYRENQAKAQGTWRARHPDYWRRYRQTHPACRDRNRDMQRQRHARRHAEPIAKMDASNLPIPSALRHLLAICRPQENQGVARELALVFAKVPVTTSNEMRSKSFDPI